MATKTLKTRIQHKNGSASDWSQAITFVPLKGELIIYNDATTPKIKIGDGTTLVENLPFVGTSITLNGAIASSPSFYAPTSAGTAGQVLQSNGSGVPSWITLGSNAYTSTAYLPLTGGTMTGTITIPATSGTRLLWGQATDTNTAYNIPWYSLSFYDDGVQQGNVLGLANYWGINFITGGDSNTNLYHNGNQILNTSNYSYYALPLTGGSMKGQIQFNGDFSYPGIWFKNPDNNKNVGAVYMNPTANNYMHIRWARDDGGGDGYYYLNGSPIDGTVSAPKFEGSYEAGSTDSTTYKHFRVSRLSTDGNYAQGYFYVVGSGTAAQIGVSKNGTNIGTATFGTNFQYTGKVIAAGATFSQDIIMNSSTITSSKDTVTYLAGNQGQAIINSTADGNGYTMLAKMNSPTGVFTIGRYQDCFTLFYTANSIINAGTNNFSHRITLLQEDGSSTFNKLYGAVWNDYAEYRSQNETIEPGYITYCDDDGKLKKTVERLQKYEGVVSDTFGFAIGKTDDCKTPLAVSGRALVYCDPEEHFHSGDCVCAGPDGLAYHMTREEIIEFPDRIVGVVSEIPTYETWGTGNVKVDGRIWIRIK